MLLLVATGHPDFIRYAHPNLGRLFGPRDTSSLTKSAAIVPWAADNDCYNGLDAAAYRRMLAKIAGVPSCLFVTVPDVVSDHEATLARWHEWLPELVEHGLPPAFVAQDGATSAEIPWDAMACLFIGGSTIYKLSSDAADLAREAKERGKLVHMGRVNTARRIQYANAIGCDSVDGTKWCRFKETYLSEGLRLVSEPRQLQLDR